MVALFAKFPASDIGLTVVESNIHGDPPSTADRLDRIAINNHMYFRRGIGLQSVK